MSSTSMKAAGTKSILTPSITLKGHGNGIRAISYFPDGQRMISGSHDKTTRQWDLKMGKEIEKARDVCEGDVYAVAVSRNGRWVATTGGGDGSHGELKVCEVETGFVKKFKGHSHAILCIDISADNTLLASGSFDGTAIWNMDTGKLEAGPFKSVDWVGVIRFSPDSKKLAVMSLTGSCLEVWDVQSQKLDVRIGTNSILPIKFAPVFWTNDNKNILAAFSFTKDDHPKTVYGFDSSTLQTVGSPFQGHTGRVTGLALSFRGALLASASYDNTIKLWDFESRQLLASFDVQNPWILVLSPNSRQLAYTVHTEDDCNIYICDTPPEVLAQARTSARKKAALHDLLNSDATRPAAGRRRPPISVTPMAPRPVLTTEPQQPILLRLSNFLRFSPSTNAVRPGRKDQSRDPLDFPATSPLPSNRTHGESTPSTSLPGRSAFVNPTRSSSGKGKQKALEPKREPVQSVDVPLGQATYADAVGVDDGYRPYVVFFCLSWFQKKEKKPKPRPVYDDELEDDEKEENVSVPVSVPPRVPEEVEMQIFAGQPRPEAGPSCPAVTDHLEA